MKKTWKKIGAVVVSGMLFGSAAGAAFVGVTYAKAPWNASQIVSSAEEEKENTIFPVSSVSANAQNEEKNENQSLDVSDIAKIAMPSIVAITNQSVQEVQSYFSMFGRGGQTMQQEVESTGSGIIIGQNEEELLIVTNNHVIEDADTLSVCFVNDQVYDAYVKGSDAAQDLAVIAVKLSSLDADTKEAIAVIEIGDSDALEVGEQVVAIGNALGYGQSVTSGWVSAVDRKISSSDSETGYIQTDAAINPGNSGGALLNMKGELIGINSAKLADTSVEGMGYAIPVNTAAPIVNELVNQTVRTKVDTSEACSIGIGGQTVSASITQMYGIPTGVYIAQVQENSAAQKAGLQVGYVITQFDHKSITSTEDLTELLEYYAAGETVDITVKVVSQGEYTQEEISLTLGAASDVRE